MEKVLIAQWSAYAFASKKEQFPKTPNRMHKNMNKIFALVAVLFLLSGCEYLQNLRQDDGSGETVAIARVGETYLYREDLAGIIPNRASENDSASLASRYIDSWIQKQLMLQAAEKETLLEEAEINRRIEDYKYELLVYAYEKRYILDHLDSVVTDAQIQEYYNNNLDNFQLRQNIVKAIYAKVPNETRRLNSLKRMMSTNALDKMEEISSYLVEFADSYQVNDSIWTDFDDLIESSPFVSEIPNKVQTIRRQRFLETSDSTHTYYIRILDYKVSDGVSPLDFVRNQVEDIILNKRKMEIRKKHEEEIRSQAEKNDDYEIFK